MTVGYFDPVGEEAHLPSIEKRQDIYGKHRFVLTSESTTIQLSPSSFHLPAMDDKNEVMHIEEQVAPGADITNLKLLSTNGTVLIPQPTADPNGEP